MGAIIVCEKRMTGHLSFSFHFSDPLRHYMQDLCCLSLPLFFACVHLYQRIHVWRLTKLLRRNFHGPFKRPIKMLQMIILSRLFSFILNINEKWLIWPLDFLFFLFLVFFATWTLKFSARFLDIRYSSFEIHPRNTHILKIITMFTDEDSDDVLSSPTTIDPPVDLSTTGIMRRPRLMNGNASSSSPPLNPLLESPMESDSDDDYITVTTLGLDRQFRTEPYHQDSITCGVCQKVFALSDIIKFIRHKVKKCNNLSSKYNAILVLFQTKFEITVCQSCSLFCSDLYEIMTFRFLFSLEQEVCLLLLCLSKSFSSCLSNHSLMQSLTHKRPQNHFFQF